MRQLSRNEIESSYSSYLKDESKLNGGWAELLFLPETEDEVADALRTLAAKELTATIGGGRTGLVGGAVPFGGGLISLERLRRVKGIHPGTNPQEWLVRSEPGVTLAELARMLAHKDFPDSKDWSAPDQADLAAFRQDPRAYYYPVDVTEDSAHLGGTVATNASGSRSFRFGATRRHIRGLRLILANGEKMTIRRGEQLVPAGGSFGEIMTGRNLEVPRYRPPQLKNAAGYFAADDMDLIDFFIGSEGTLGVVTEVELVLTVKPEQILSFLAFCQGREEAFTLVEKARALPEAKRPSAIEYFDGRSLDLLRRTGAATGDGTLQSIPQAGAAVMIEIGTCEADLEEDLSAWDELLTGCRVPSDAVWFEEESEQHGRLRHLRHALPEAVNNLIASRQSEVPELHKVATDFAVPASSLRELDRLYERTLEGLEYVIFGHIGDSHLHVNVLPRSLEELKRAKAFYLEIAAWAVARGGTVSAEHGIGKIKREVLAVMFNPEALADMRRVKEYFDPSGLLNPGNVFNK